MHSKTSTSGHRNGHEPTITLASLRLQCTGNTRVYLVTAGRDVNVSALSLFNNQLFVCFSKKLDQSFQCVLPTRPWKREASGLEPKPFVQGGVVPDDLMDEHPTTLTENIAGKKRERKRLVIDQDLNGSSLSTLFGC